MKTSKAFIAALGLATIALAPNALADQWNKKTYLTVNEAVQVPGKVLQPGRYVMKLLESSANRHIVQIFNERENQLQTTILAIPNYRLQPTGKTEFQWWETPAGQPKALRAWFYPGDNFGQEFAYPKTEAVKLATTGTQNVPTTYAQSEADLATARVGTVDRAGTELELDRQTYSRADGMQPGQVAQARPQTEQPRVTERPRTEVAQAPRVTERPRTEVAQAPRVTERPAMTMDDGGKPARRRLPKTASQLPLAALVGFTALGLSVGVRALARRK
ncbi:MAG: hypothetical protein WKF37_03950 [Bryobacteraceae bacterium]